MSPLTWRRWLVVAGVVLIAALLSIKARGLSEGLFEQRVAARFPVQAAAYVRDHGCEGPLFNDFNWGGYLIWQLYPTYRVSIDGRMAVYGPARFAEHVTITELRPGWREALDRLDPAVAILRTGSPVRVKICSVTAAASASL